MSLLVSLVTAVLTFFLSALALKLALQAMGQPARENSYGTAVTVAAILSLSGLILGFFPFFVSWVAYPILWLLIVRGVYHISLTKSLGVALLQGLIRFGLVVLLGMLF